MSLVSFLTSHHAGELVFDKLELHEIDEHTTVQQALKILKEKNIRALPVTRTEGGKKSYTGIISSFDLMAFIGFASYFSDLVEAKTEEEKAKAFGELQIATTTVKDLVGQVSAEGRTLWTFAPTQSLLPVFDYFSKGVHRALVEQKDDHTGALSFRLLSQTDVISFLGAHMGSPSLARIFSKPIEELNLCNPLGRGSREPELVTISTKETALEGFRVMHVKDIQAVPVVDDQGVIVSTLSTSDTKGLDANNITKCLLPVIDFLKEMHGGRLIHPITCTPKDTLGEVVLKMKVATIHRHQVWVTNAERKPIDVVSMSDVLRTLHAAAQKEEGGQ